MQTNDYLQQDLSEYARERMARDERMDVVYSILAQSPFALPLRVIARRMGMKKTPYLWGIMNELVENGDVVREAATTIRGQTVYLFSAVFND